VSIRSRYNDDRFDDPKVLWEVIQSDIENVIMLDIRFEMAKLTDCKLKLYLFIPGSFTLQEKIINDHAISHITIDDSWPMFYILSNLTNNDKW